MSRSASSTSFAVDAESRRPSSPEPSRRCTPPPAALTRYRDSDRVLDALGEHAYVAGVAARNQRVRTARLKLAAVRDAHSIHTLPPTAELERRWTTLNDDQRREVIAQVIDCVFVRPGQLHVEERVTVCRAGTAPRLPRRGSYKGGEARPFTATARHRLPALQAVADSSHRARARRLPRQPARMADRRPVRGCRTPPPL